MPVEFDCEQCGKRMWASGKMAGRPVVCDACGWTSKVPMLKEFTLQAAPMPDFGIDLGRTGVLSDITSIPPPPRPTLWKNPVVRICVILSACILAAFGLRLWRQSIDETHRAEVAAIRAEFELERGKHATPAPDAGDAGRVGEFSSASVGEIRQFMANTKPGTWLASFAADRFLTDDYRDPEAGPVNSLIQLCDKFYEDGEGEIADLSIRAIKEARKNGLTLTPVEFLEGSMLWAPPAYFTRGKPAKFSEFANMYFIYRTEKRTSHAETMQALRALYRGLYPGQ